jgi:hypothetical protein
MKVTCIEWKAEKYETMRTVYKTEWKEEACTYYTCELVPEKKTRTVTCYKMVPETKDVVVTRVECVPSTEEKTVTCNVWVCKPVKKTVDVCVDKGHWEEKQVPCASACATSCCSSGRRGLFHRRHHDCGDSCCATTTDCCAPAPTMQTVKCWVSNIVTEKKEIEVMERVCETKTQKVMCTTYKMVEKKETVKCTTYKCVPESKTEEYTCYTTRQVEHKGTRKVCHCVPVQEKVTCTRMVPVKVEKEIEVCAPTTCCAAPCDSGCGHRGLFGGLFHRRHGDCCE